MSVDNEDWNDIGQQILLAENGDAEAQNILGARFATGRGVDKNEAGAAYWYSQAVNQGYVHAKWNIATMFLNAEGGLLRNIELAMKLIYQAAEDGDDSACHFLSMCYESGQFVKYPDQEMAEAWERRAHEKRKINVLGEKIDIQNFLNISLKKPSVVRHNK